MEGFFSMINDGLVAIDDFIWGVPLMVLILFGGILLTVRLRGVQLRFSPEEHARSYHPEELAERLRQLFSRTARQMILRLREEYPRSDILTVGGCHLCEHCTRPEGRPCRYPEGIGYTLESLGCDVSTAAEQLLGWPLLWSRKGCLPEYMALVCGVLIR